MYDKEDIELVKSLISKTTENKIEWKKGYTDWYFISKIPNSTFEIHFKKEMENLVWVYILSIEDKNKTEREISFLSPSKEPIPNFRLPQFYEDFNLVESLFITIKKIVDKHDILVMSNFKELINNL